MALSSLRSRTRLIALLLSITAVPIVAVAQEAPTSAATPVGASSFVPVSPSRLVDTRQVVCGCTPLGVNEFSVQVSTRASVPAGATAAVVTLTMTGATGQGFLSAWPTGGVRPVVSSVNVSRAGQTVANTQIIPLSAAGAMSVFTSVPSAVLVDVVGYFVPAALGVAAGRFLPTSPVRLADTRLPGGGGLAAAGATRTFDPRPLLPGVGYSAVAINVTMTGTTGWGYLTTWPAGQAMPTTSTVNADAPGENRAAFTIVPTSDAFNVFVGNSATHVVIDIVGVFTNNTAATSEAGLFVPVTPTRWFDTRQVGGGGAFVAGETRSYMHSGVAPVDGGAIPTTAGAMVANVTMTGAAPGYVTAYAADIGLPSTSTVNTSVVDDNIANGALVSLSAVGGVSFTASTSTQLVVDYTGWFTRAPVVVPTPTTTTTNPTTTTVPAGTCTQLPLSSPQAWIGSSSFNDWRAAIGVAPLTVSPKLSASACEWAKLLYQYKGLVPGYGSSGHSSDNWLCGQWGYPAPLYLNCPTSGEVIGGGTGTTETATTGAAGMQSLWYGSPGHYQTATDPIYTVAGYAGVCGPDPTFGQRCWYVGQFATKEPNP